MFNLFGNEKSTPLSIGSPLLLPLVGVSLLGNLLTFLGFTFNVFPNLDGEILSFGELGEIHDEIISPLKSLMMPKIISQVLKFKTIL